MRPGAPPGPAHPLPAGLGLGRSEASSEAAGERHPDDCRIPRNRFRRGVAGGVTHRLWGPLGLQAALDFRRPRCSLGVWQGRQSNLQSPRARSLADPAMFHGAQRWMWSRVSTSRAGHRLCVTRIPKRPPSRKLDRCKHMRMGARLGGPWYIAPSADFELRA